jgi:stress response protein YsnF
VAKHKDKPEIEHTHPGGDQPHTHEGMAEHTHGASTGATGGETVQLREEELRATKRPVQTGQVGIR